MRFLIFCNIDSCRAYINHMLQLPLRISVNVFKLITTFCAFPNLFEIEFIEFPLC